MNNFCILLIMKRKIIYLIVIFSISLYLNSIVYAASQIIESFTAVVVSDAINIEWKTSSEENIARFEIQRLQGTTFKTISSKTAIGKPSSYKYIDSDNFSKGATTDSQQSSYQATYRIKIVFSDYHTTYSDETSVTRHSSIKRTLGMLKEMFK